MLYTVKTYYIHLAVPVCMPAGFSFDSIAQWIYFDTFAFFCFSKVDSIQNNKWTYNNNNNHFVWMWSSSWARAGVEYSHTQFFFSIRVTRSDVSVRIFVYNIKNDCFSLCRILKSNIKCPFFKRKKTLWCHFCSMSVFFFDSLNIIEWRFYRIVCCWAHQIESILAYKFKRWISWTKRQFMAMSKLPYSIRFIWL